MADSSREFLLEMTDICKSFPGVKALDNVNLRVRPHSIHALMGENGAGKSTLLKCLFGIYKKDSGSIVFQGREIDFKSSKEALEHGVSMVHQELNLVLQRTVMDNMWLGRYPTKGLFVDQDKMFKDTQAIFDELDIDINPREKVGNLSVSQMQMIEIAKAFSYDAKIVIMDEPTSSLTEKEVNHLFTIIRKLKERGCGIVYISHKMEEIFQLCDEITVLRDGQWIATQPLEGLDMDKIIAMMVGRSLSQRFPDRQNTPGEVILEVKNLTSLRQPSIRDVSFDLHQGEILGIAGLAGAGKTELCKALFGASAVQLERGELRGQPWVPRAPHLSVEQGLALVPEERRKEGIFIDEAIPMNLSVSADDSFSRWSLFSRRQELRWAREIMQRLNIRASGPQQRLARLSGGNQQKVAIGKWLRGDAEVLIFDEPTKGVDIKAKQELFSLIDGLARAGKGVIYASGEFAELIGLCDRICVLWDGRIVAELNAADIDEETLLLYSTGGTPA
ncbi:sugar ABC transporter ATP-binding protein [Serratia marcescens]|nr:ATP-binding cassette domain-containing protein [Serratia marcescens]RTG20593.1 ATP-binding cassette domain-containing protein [Serratia marcescens]RTG30948.1 ATP-binding cassette domain-containing protein [Serratia marcescens]RTG62476.1 ATP-binding cassette domain-containing protein [Serratia marcescens]